MDKWQQCPLFEWCPNHTATCRVCLPDDGCYWYRWFESLIKENLTMEENSITITIDNYCGQRITFTMSEDAKVESLFELDTDSIKITHISIDAYDSDILIKKEDI